MNATVGSPILTPEQRADRRARWQAEDAAKAKAELGSTIEIITAEDNTFGAEGDIQVTIPAGTAIARLPRTPALMAELFHSPTGEELECPAGGFQVTLKQFGKMLAKEGGLSVRMIPSTPAPTSTPKK